MVTHPRVLPAQHDYQDGCEKSVDGTDVAQPGQPGKLDGLRGSEGAEGDANVGKNGIERGRQVQ